MCSPIQKTTLEVPNWGGLYVYSYSHLRYANKAQKQFYGILKSEFLNGIYLDIENNDNYAYMLVFDLFRDYKSHLDIETIKNQVKQLKDNYPCTTSEGFNMLLATIYDDNLDRNAVNSMIDEYPYYPWSTAQLYGKKLNLTNDERAIISCVKFSSSTFTNIEFCKLELIKLFFTSLKDLNQEYAAQDSSLYDQFEFMGDLIARKHFRFRNRSRNYNKCITNSPSLVYSNLFSVCDNYVRSFYGYKRAASLDEYCTNPNITDMFEANICDRFKTIVEANGSTIAIADEETTILLNGINTNGWKVDFALLEEKTESITPLEYFNQVVEIGRLNQKNPALKALFYEATKKIATTDNTTAIKLYMYYIVADMQSPLSNRKELLKTTQKTLFKSPEQIGKFNDIIFTLTIDKNIKKALVEADVFYHVARKKISINRDHIKEVSIQHTQTVELLNEYLQDEDEEITTLNNTNTNKDNTIAKDKPTNNKSSITLTDGLIFNDMQLKVVELFAKSKLTLNIKEADQFIKENGYFAGQIIDSINECCYEILDDNLIEQEDDLYIIDDEYYKIIIQ